MVCLSLFQWATFFPELFTVTHPSCVVLQGMAHGFIELCKSLHYNKAGNHEGIYNMDETQKYYAKWKKIRSKKPSYSPSSTLQKLICDSVYMKHLELADLIISRECGREVGRWLLKGYGAFFWKDENIRNCWSLFLDDTNWLFYIQFASLHTLLNVYQACFILLCYFL